MTLSISTGPGANEAPCDICGYSADTQEGGATYCSPCHSIVRTCRTHDHDRWTYEIGDDVRLTCRWCECPQSECVCVECAECQVDVTHGPRVGRRAHTYCSVECAEA